MQTMLEFSEALEIAVDYASVSVVHEVDARFRIRCRLCHP
jgi:hypothetical protein